MNLAQIEFENRDGVVIAALRGEIDLSNASAIGEQIADRMSNDVLSLVLDLQAATYLDSAGIQLIYRLRESLRARAQSLRLVVPDASASHAALRLAGVQQQLGCAQTVEEALGQLHSDG